MLSSDIIDGFKKAGIPRNYNADEPVFLSDEPSTGMYLILKGEVKVMRRTPDGELVEVAHMGAGQTMGEISLLLGQPHSATVIAVNAVETLLLTQNRLEELREEEPELALSLFEILAFTLAGHMMDQNRWIDELRKKVSKLEQRLQEEVSPYSYFN
jgi:thioredoxin reductase (NADPH)